MSRCASGARDPRLKIFKPYVFYLCLQCRLRSQIPSESSANLFDVQIQAEEETVARFQELRADESVLRALSRATRGRRLLEIGPGDGRFLAAARKAGFECLGVDVSEPLAARARERSGVEVLVGQLPQLGLRRGSFDIVNIEQVLEYVEDPVGMLTEVAALLAPGGICRIREYDADSLSARRAGRSYWLFCPTVLNVWSRRSIRMLAQQSGLQVAKTHHGTEATFSDWLSTVRNRSLAELLTCSARAILRKAHFFGLAVGADTVFYLRARAA